MRLEPITQALADGRGTDALAACEELLTRCESIPSQTEDSDGELASVLRELQELHSRACACAEPDPTRLAEQLFHWALESGGRVLVDAARTHAGVLGARGISRYREIAEERWRGVPPVRPGEQETPIDRRRIALTRIMELLAEEDDAPEDFVAVLAKDLSSPASFLRIAEVLRTSGRNEDALRWLQKGLNAFGEFADPRLVESTVNLLVTLERHTEATALSWRRFDQLKDLTGYLLLQTAASAAGQWKQFRARAIYILEMQSPGTAACGTLVEIHLREQDVERAWACAKERGAPDDLWLELARAREARHPSECAAVYEHAAERALFESEHPRKIIALVEHVHGLRVRAGEIGEFHGWIGRLRREHASRPRFVATLDRYFPPRRGQ